jgi:hypothetical protein
MCVRDQRLERGKERSKSSMLKTNIGERARPLVSGHKWLSAETFYWVSFYDEDMSPVLLR